jgi:hypothetical protein
MGLVDGFNPCAMWVLVFLLTLLVNLKSRARMALIAGIFVIISGIVYFAFMAAWLNFFFLVGVTRTLQIGLGILAVAFGSFNKKNIFCFKPGVSQCNPQTAQTRN